MSRLHRRRCGIVRLRARSPALLRSLCSRSRPRGWCLGRSRSRGPHSGAMGLSHGFVVRLELHDGARARARASAHRLSPRQGTRRLERDQRDGAHSRQSCRASIAGARSAIPDGATTICCRSFARGERSSAVSAVSTIRTPAITRFCAAASEQGFGARCQPRLQRPGTRGRRRVPSEEHPGRPATQYARRPFSRRRSRGRTSRSARRHTRPVCVLEGRRVVGVEYLRDGRLERVRARPGGRALCGRCRFAEAADAVGHRRR